MHATTLRSLATIIILLLVAWGEPGQAQVSDSAAAISAAQQHFDDGVAAYKQKDFERALQEFSQAYAQVPSAIFLYNAARVAEKLEKFDESLKFAELAQTEAQRPLPDALLEKNANLIVTLKRRLARAEAETNQMKVTKFVRPAAASTPAQTPIKPAPAAPAPTDQGWSALGYSGAGIGLLGLGLIGTSIYLSTDASTQIDELSAIEDPKAFNQRIDEIDAQQFTGQVLLYSGIAAVTVGGALVAWDLLGSTERLASKTAPGESVTLTGVAIDVSPERTQVGIRIRGVY